VDVMAGKDIKLISQQHFAPAFLQQSKHSHNDDPFEVAKFPGSLITTMH